MQLATVTLYPFLPYFDVRCYQVVGRIARHTEGRTHTVLEFAAEPHPGSYATPVPPLRSGGRVCQGAPTSISETVKSRSKCKDLSPLGGLLLLVLQWKVQCALLPAGRSDHTPTTALGRGGPPRLRCSSVHPTL